MFSVSFNYIVSSTVPVERNELLSAAPALAALTSFGSYFLNYVLGCFWAYGYVFVIGFSGTEKTSIVLELEVSRVTNDCGS
jgi:hypothetical protein